MQEYTHFSQIIDDDNPLFNEIWDEATSEVEEEKKDSEIEPICLPVAPKPIPILKPAKARREKLAISTIFACPEDQSVTSTISKSTYNSTVSSLAISAFLVDAHAHRGEAISKRNEDKVPEISNTHNESTRTPPHKYFPESMFLGIFESVFGEQMLNVSCSNQGIVINSLQVSKEDETKESAGPSKQEEIPIDSNPGKCVPCGEVFLPCHGPKNVEVLERADVDPQPTQNPMAPRIYLNDSEPVLNIPNFLSSTASRFLSSSLSVDEMSTIYFVAADEEKEPPTSGEKDAADEKEEPSATSGEKDAVDEKEEPPSTSGEKEEPSDSSGSAHTENAVMMLDFQATVTLKEKRLDERSLLDSMTTLDLPASSEEKTEDQTEDPLEENITEGLGLTLPPLPAPKKLEPINTEDIHDAIYETIEVDVTGTIVIHGGNTSNIDTDKKSNRGKKINKENSRETVPDVYITYKIEGYPSDDNTSLSRSETSHSSHTTPKQNSGLKSYLKPRWGRKIKLFSGIKDKSDGATAVMGGGLKKSIWDSPGADTATTAPTVATTPMSVSEELVPRYRHFSLRPRTRSRLKASI